MNDIERARAALADAIDLVDAKDNDLPAWAMAVKLRGAFLAYEGAQERRAHRVQLALAACAAEADALDVDAPCAYFGRGKADPCAGCPAYADGDAPCVKRVVADMLGRVADVMGG